MKLYVAGPWAHRSAAIQAAEYLASRGFEIVSRWLHEHEDTTSHPALQREALSDVADVRACDALVLLNLAKSDGKASELGMAYILGKPIIVVGSSTGNVFYHLPEVTVVDTLEQAISILKQLQS